ncbi:hypothetical protein VIBNISOn1_1480008 [Vibrio nigripulchritudo SOn1]|uniref:Uncharacterized protein n=1 Tax=Vibrio nigripulchritudo SOn1 TaxID=1238450 RepID=A0AAV2VL46_9VIBR|nr:hypothetical protein [Vibrio nigripulchritudo]CCO45434.1 hypothetical protein VIBNISOn1_1480008 [Vibrio nigripulchritudo SOn1]
MKSWQKMENGTHHLVVSDTFQITLYPHESYAIASGIDGKIGLIDASLEEQKTQVQRVVVSVLLDICEKVCPDNKRYGRE